MDPLSLAIGATGVVGFGAGWHWRRRVRRAEAVIAGLRCDLEVQHRAARHDPLTGLPNRRAFFEYGAALLADPARRRVVAVVFDLDGLKQINDRYGHTAGDDVLVAVARRFAIYAGDNLIARLGGDEFAGLFTSPTADERWLDRAAQHLSATLAAPFRTPLPGLIVTASIGLAPVHGTDLMEALHRADVAMYRAKANRRILDAVGASLDATEYGRTRPITAHISWPGRHPIKPAAGHRLIDLAPPVQAGGQ